MKKRTSLLEFLLYWFALLFEATSLTGCVSIERRSFSAVRCLLTQLAVGEGLDGFKGKEEEEEEESFMHQHGCTVWRTYG